MFCVETLFTISRCVMSPAVESCRVARNDHKNLYSCPSREQQVSVNEFEGGVWSGERNGECQRSR